MNGSTEKSPDKGRNSAFLLEAREIRKYFPVRTGIGDGSRLLKAVDGVSFGVGRNSVFAVVGESGCGKSTLAKIMVKLLEPTSGSLFFRGRDISNLSNHELTGFRKAAQIIFQDPFASLNPRMRIADILSEPYKIHRLAGRAETRKKIAELLGRVGLNEDALFKYPHEFSGGQRQRICIARALSVSPELIVADEPLSALDVSIQAQTLNLLQEIRRDMELSIILISHDLRVVRYLSDEVAIMYLGRFVEKGPTDIIFSNPRHPYTRLLLSSAPRLRYNTAEAEPSLEVAHITGDIPGGSNIPSGCPFHPRCPERFGPCDKTCPELEKDGASYVACHKK
jgi:peptide/nickel transport system ATP-binding protein/oligopeptide transport system ATP-binding protein